MGKFMKRCAITALVFIVLGFVLAAVSGTIKGGELAGKVKSAIQDGTLKESLDEWKEWGISAGEGVMDELGQVNYEIEEQVFFDEEHEVRSGDVGRYSPGSLVRGGSATEGGIGCITMEVGGYSVEFEPSEDGDFYIEASGTEKFQSYVEDDTLYVRAVRSTGTTGSDGIGTITLYVPQDAVLQEVEIELGAGILNLGKLAADTIDLEVGAGQITGEEVRAHKAELKVGMGEITLSGLNVEELSAEAGMGELKIKGDIAGKAELECAMGNIDIKLAGAEQDFNYDIRGAMGKVVIGQQEYSNMTQEKTIKNGAAKNIDVECAVGSVTIAFEESNTPPQ